ncbi:hypothetical protein FHT76_006733 [Rhizobium sp. BK176]|nr:hypothetical protein [Rhizobium sp. BK181]MBB3542903.1 hypothetical protein [Rhizobium sp. BK399]MCS3742804.1 hypothetical protein [Rhizobium sp. BK661]MCS4095024.1 hypothetical protein [Rhizobium sp. BK176]
MCLPEQRDPFLYNLGVCSGCSEPVASLCRGRNNVRGQYRDVLKDPLVVGRRSHQVALRELHKLGIVATKYGSEPPRFRRAE